MFRCFKPTTTPPDSLPFLPEKKGRSQKVNVGTLQSLEGGSLSSVQVFIPFLQVDNQLAEGKTLA